MSFYSGSTYQGDTLEGWYHGSGTFTYPSGIKYVGSFHKGQFHGEGTLVYQNGGKFKGTWQHGKLKGGNYFFFDDLRYEEKDWNYCRDQDRRFNYERNNGILPAGQTQLINDISGEKKIPAGTYDTGDGFYDPIRSIVLEYEGAKIKRTVDAEEADWITRKCRYEPRTTSYEITGEEDKVIMRVVQMQEESRKSKEEIDEKSEKKEEEKNNKPEKEKEEKVPNNKEKLKKVNEKAKSVELESSDSEEEEKKIAEKKKLI